MKEPEITRKWIAAAKLLAVDPSAKVACPVCEQEYLTVLDVPMEGTRKFDRYMICPNCQSRNILLMTKLD